MAKKYYITTAIDYTNDVIHIGHAYQKVIADILARWHKLAGEDVFFLTGTDEHGQKIFNAAKAKGLEPKKFVDEISGADRKEQDSLNISYNRFIRTTDKDHEQVAQELTKLIFKKGDIYKGVYEGLYCIGCEAYLTEKDLVDGKCPLHNKEPQILKEETYFFKLSKYQKQLLEHYRKNPEFILPESRRNEIINRVKDGLKDLSITRTSFSWGIPSLIDKKHFLYVWWEALINYLSGVDWPKDKFKKFWPADAHLLGKDNGWFHAVIWPAMLLSAGIKLPRTVFVHGYLTFNGQKISKSLGNTILSSALAGKYGADSVRYYLARAVPFGEDGDFSEKDLVARHNNELADKLGNLISRVSALAEKYGLAKTENKLLKKLKLKEIEKHIENYELDKALNLIFEFIDSCNLYVQENKLWETHDKKRLYELADSIKAVAILLWPFIPDTCEKIAKQFKFELKYGEIKKTYKVQKISKAEILFRKIEQNPEQNKTEEKIEGIIKMTDIKFNEWEKIDLRAGKIVKAEDIEGADKLYRLEVDLGKEKRILVAGLKQYYKKDELKGKRCVVFCNLEPRVMRGIKSEGMILAAVSADRGNVSLVAPDKDIELGSRIS